MPIRFPDNGSASTVPTAIADGRRFVVPAGTQMLYAEPIEIEGDAVIQIDGVLIEVD